MKDVTKDLLDRAQRELSDANEAHRSYMDTVARLVKERDLLAEKLAEANEFFYITVAWTLNGGSLDWLRDAIRSQNGMNCPELMFSAAKRISKLAAQPEGEK